MNRQKMKHALVGLVGIAGAVAACSANPTRSTMKRESDGFSVASLPPEHREEYMLFAQRCSKCHSLARPLNNGEHDEVYWARYVERMRRQPSSGISPEDVPPILRFLNFYSAELRASSTSPNGSSRP